MTASRLVNWVTKEAESLVWATWACRVTSACCCSSSIRNPAVAISRTTRRSYISGTLTRSARSLVPMASPSRGMQANTWNSASHRRHARIWVCAATYFVNPTSRQCPGTCRGTIGTYQFLEALRKSREGAQGSPIRREEFQVGRREGKRGQVQLYTIFEYTAPTLLPRC